MAVTPHRIQFSIQPVVEGDEILNHGLNVGSKIVFDGHFSSRRCEEFALISAMSNFGQPQLLTSNVGPTTEVNCSRISHVESWINQELFGDVVEASTQPHQDEGEVYITTLGKHVDEYIDMMDLMCTTWDSQPWISYNGIGGLELCHMNAPEGTMDDLSLSRVDSECHGMYYDEPQLWNFT